jgi:hypothetical protein
MFRDKIVLITGGTSGIGLSLARAFVRENARVTVCGRDAGRLQAARDALPGIVTISCDITYVDQVEAMIADIDARHGRLDILVNNAGYLVERLTSGAPERTTLATTRYAASYDNSVQTRHDPVEPPPDPCRDVLERRHLEPVDIVEVLMVEILTQRFDVGLDIDKAGRPSELDVRGAGHHDFDHERVPVQTGEGRQLMRRFEGELSEGFYHVDRSVLRLHRGLRFCRHHVTFDRFKIDENGITSGPLRRLEPRRSRKFPLFPVQRGSRRQALPKTETSVGGSKIPTYLT